MADHYTQTHTNMSTRKGLIKTMTHVSVKTMHRHIKWQQSLHDCVCNDRSAWPSLICVLLRGLGKTLLSWKTCHGANKLCREVCARMLCASQFHSTQTNWVTVHVSVYVRASMQEVVSVQQINCILWWNSFGTMLMQRTSAMIHCSTKARSEMQTLFVKEHIPISAVQPFLCKPVTSARERKQASLKEQSRNYSHAITRT